MGIFSNTTKNIKNEDFETLANRISYLKIEVVTLKKDLEVQKNLINSINGRINRKLNPEVQEESIKTGFPYNLGGGGLS